ncbi:MAG: glycosyltransferase family 4 protein [Betaproteobacteria bacterium]|nr:glycosyltransferase family 4 protein [Betaproteobacteria bacterium]
MSHSAAIYFHPEAYTTTGPKLMGRNAAGESFLRGYLAHSRGTRFWVQAAAAEHALAFEEAVRAAGRTEPVERVGAKNLARLAEAGTAYHPGPRLGEHAWQRSFHGHGAWSLCGVTHTTASARAMDGIAEWLTAPVQPWDAVICTSSAVRDNVQRILHTQGEYLQARLGATKRVLPQLPVIPLGIHAADFAFGAQQRQGARRQLEVGEDDLVVLFAGRLSFHAKAHPLAMYQALEQAARKLPATQKVVLVECGWHAGESIREAFADAARQACPSVRCVTLDGREAAARATAWAGADVFCSLSDNIQETFGLVPVEAMAAGLPVVVSDWDGYRDTVREGVDGFRVPTLMPAAGLGRDLALRHALEIDSYDQYCGYTCSLVAVDVEATARAFERLFSSPELRRQMGEAGRQRARENYDWAAIIPRYEALWAELAEIRAAQGAQLKHAAQPWPARMDPFAAFAAYPTAVLKPDTRLRLARTDALEALARWRGLMMVDFARSVLPSPQECEIVIQQLAKGPRPAAELVKPLPAARQPAVFRGLAWMVKLGVVAQG